MSVVAATKNGKIQIFNPLDNNDTKSKFKYLNINKDITSLGIGPLNPDKKRDMLVVCTESTLHAYDVEDNRDLFFADVIDGIKTMTIGNFKMNEPPLSIVGGNCSILGYNYEGTDVYWSVTGDDVTALAFMDINEDKENELFVASKDYEVKFMKNVRYENINIGRGDNGVYRSKACNNCITLPARYICLRSGQWYNWNISKL